MQINTQNNAVPIAGPISGGSSNVDLISQLTGQGLTAAEMQSLATAAATPIPGGHSLEQPASLMGTPSVAGQAPLDRRPVVGKREARTRGIGNAIVGAMNAVSGVSTAEVNKKKMQIATDTHTLLVEQDSIDQAKQVLNTLPKDSPQRQQYMDMIQKATQRQQAILQDPKTAKAIARGFHIDLTDPEANKTMEHEAVADGKKMAETSIGHKPSLAEQFQSQLPSTLQPNVQAQSRHAAAQENQKYRAEFIKAILPELIRAPLEERIEIMRSNTELQKEKMALDDRDFQRQQRFNDQLRLLDVKDRYRANDEIREIGVEEQKELRRLADVAKDPNTIQQKSDESSREWSGKVESAAGRYQSATTALNNLSLTPGATQQEIDKAQAQVDLAKANYDSAVDHQTYNAGVWAARRVAAHIPDEPIRGENPSDTGSNATGGSTNTNPNASSILTYTGNQEEFINRLNSGEVQYNPLAVP